MTMWARDGGEFSRDWSHDGRVAILHVGLFKIDVAALATQRDVRSFKPKVTMGTDLLNVVCLEIMV